jgi:chromatin segregation and condensation protein Rec8/ScpA/Scc1 (kleisin family)
MAKARKSAFSTNTSKEQVAKEAKAVEREVLGDAVTREQKPERPQAPEPKARKPRTPKPKAVTKKAPAQTEKVSRRKFLYVDEPHHRAAKVKAIQMSLSMSEYIEMLIARDNKG